MVFSMILPVIDIDIWQTRDEELKLLFVEDCDQLWRDNVVEAWLSLAYEKRFISHDSYLVKTSLAVLAQIL